MGWIDRAGLAALLALAAGCASSAPAAPPPAPEPEAKAPEPVPDPPAPAPDPLAVLALVPGSEHLFRQEVRFEVNPVGSSAMGALHFRLQSDLRYTIVSADGKGGAEIESVLARVAGAIEIPKMGMSIAFDSADPPADDSPMSQMYAGFFAGVGKRNAFRVRRGKFPEMAAAAAAPPEGPEAGEMFPMGEFSLLAWLDLLPVEAVRSGAKGSVAMDSWGGFLGGVRDHAPVVEVRSYDPATGVAEFAAEVGAEALAGKAAAEGKEGFSPKRMRFTDRFDVPAGRYLSRAMEISADVGGVEEFAMLAGEEGLELVVILKLDRVDAFPPPPAPAAAPAPPPK